jgi:hypothetical protein
MVGGFIQKYELRALDNTHNIHTKKYDDGANSWNGQDDIRLHRRIGEAPS